MLFRGGCCLGEGRVLFRGGRCLGEGVVRGGRVLLGEGVV